MDREISIVYKVAWEDALCYYQQSALGPINAHCSPRPDTTQSDQSTIRRHNE